MLCFWPSSLYFSIQNGPIWPSGRHILNHLDPVEAPWTSLFISPPKTCFFRASFSAFFLRIASQNTAKMCPYYWIWSFQVMSFRFFMVFPQTLFLNDPTVFWSCFPILAALWVSKIPTAKPLNRFWQHVVKKPLPKSYFFVKTVKKRPRLASKWATRARTQRTYFRVFLVPLSHETQVSKKHPLLTFLEKMYFC